MIWVTQSCLQEQRGYTPGQCKSRRQRTHWVEGVHYAMVDGVYMYNLTAIDSRIEKAVEELGREKSKVVRLT